MKIQFHYVNETDCNLLSEEFGKWGCCCKCSNQLEVYKHCCHVNDKNEDAFKALQKMKADEIGKESEANEHSRRMQTSLLGFKAELHDEDKRMGEELQKKKDEQAKKEYERQKKLSDGLGKIIDDQISVTEKLEDDAIQEQIKQGEKAFEESKKLKEKEAEEDKKLADKKKEDAKKLADDIIEEEKKKAEKIRDIQFEMASEAINGIFEMGSAKRDEELNALDKQREAELSNKNLTEAQKQAINEEYDKKAAAIKTKQAKSDKLQALFNIALQTAMGSMKAVAEFPLTGGMPFLAWVIAAGALQAGLVAAQKVPQFAKGTDNAPDKGLFGEAGRELMKLRSGEMFLASSPTYFEGNRFKGAQIYSNPQTEAMISHSEHSGFQGRTMTDDRLLNEMKSVRKAILSKPVNIVDTENRVIGQQKGGYREIYLNKITRS